MTAVRLTFSKCPDNWISSMCPQQGVPLRFSQLYIYYTDHEVENRMSHFGGQDLNRLCSSVRGTSAGILVPTFCVRLFSVSGSRQHALPDSNAIGAIVFDSGPRATTNYDVIVEPRGDVPRRINKLHPMYMSSQFPLMFFYGELGFHLGLMLRDVPGSSAGRERKMTMNMYYSYQIHDKLGVYNLMLRMGRLFQRYVVTVYCSIELNRMDYICHKHKDIRNEYLTDLYDAIDRGTKPVQMLVAGRYSLLHLPIARYLQTYTLLTPPDRADVVARVFHLRVGEFVAFLKEEQPFGVFRGVLYTIEFQKRGLPHCHTLLWVHSPLLSPINQRIDDYISAELPDPRTDPVGYAVICATMMHGPCGIAKSSAPCMELSACSKKFPKLYNSKTYFDADGRAHYRRRNTEIYTTRGEVKLNNSYVVPYKLLLCLTFHAHINVEFCGWTMLIKYLFKYISKGTDRVAARITRPVGNTDAQQSQVPKAIDEI
ncbi:uncharacterized protein [Rutidosis leptorrhynchoides]|uniref:uncharacterized protein n=1 Tax=Rutidosis leptorrhynchoides TaxID=125765 RepID=UPI003A994597